MNNKQQLAAMGAQYRLTEEQAKGLAERMPQTGALQILDDEPMCMAKRIEKLEAQMLVMAGLLRKARVVISESMPFFNDRSDCYKVEEIRRLPSSIDTALAATKPEDK